MSLDPEQRKELNNHFQIVNEWASIESDIQEILKRTEVGGIWHRFFNWLLVKAVQHRKRAVDEKNEYLREIEKSGR